MAGKITVFAVVVVVAGVFVFGEALKVELLREQYGTLGTKFDFYDKEYQNGEQLDSSKTFFFYVTNIINLIIIRNVDIGRH